MYVGVNDDAFFFMEPRSEHHVRCFTRDSRQGEQVVHVVRNPAAEVADNLLRRADQRLRFITKEAVDLMSGSIASGFSAAKS